MSQALAKAPADTGSVIESVIVKGDLGKLTPQERTRYYMEVCKSIGLNPLTKPFEYITLNGKLTLYALRACTDQLRSIHSVSVEDMTQTQTDGVCVVTVKVRNKDGRTDMATGAVNIGGLKGEALANAMMKTETKAKRRATLSICGLGFLDESEVDSTPLPARAGQSVVTDTIEQSVDEPTDDYPELNEPDVGKRLKILERLLAGAPSRDEIARIHAHPVIQDGLKNAPGLIRRNIQGAFQAAYDRIDKVAAAVGEPEPTPSGDEGFQAWLVDADGVQVRDQPYLDPVSFAKDIAQLVRGDPERAVDIETNNAAAIEEASEASVEAAAVFAKINALPTRIDEPQPEAVVVKAESLKDQMLAHIRSLHVTELNALDRNAQWRSQCRQLGPDDAREVEDARTTRLSFLRA